MILRRDHLAGGLFVAAGLLVFAVSGDLPVGSMAMPGAGMMPKLVTSLMLAFGVIVLLRAGESPPLAEVSWADLTHAARVIAVTAAESPYEPLDSGDHVAASVQPFHRRAQTDPARGGVQRRRDGVCLFSRDAAEIAAPAATLVLA